MYCIWYENNKLLRDRNNITFICRAWKFSDEDDADEQMDFEGDPVSFSLEDSFKG